MYIIRYGNDILHDPRDPDRILADAKAELAVNESGELSFTVNRNHPMYGLLQPMNKEQEVVLEQDGVELFRGRILYMKEGFYGGYSVKCEGELSYFNDVTLRPYSTLEADVPSSADGYFGWLVSQYNLKNDDGFRFTVGINQAWELDPNNHILRENSDRPNVAQEMKDKLLQSFGGYVRTRRSGGLRVIDYLSSGDRASSQAIEFGSNLLDFTRERDWADYYTVIIPIGAAPETEEGGEAQKIDISGEPDRELSDGLFKQGDRIIDVEAVGKYGYIERVVEFEDVTIAANLVEKAARELRNVQVGDVLELTAVDLHMLDPEIKPIYIGDFVRATSRPHGYDEWFVCSKMTIHVSEPSQNKFVLGNEYEYMTDRQAEKIAALNATINKVYEKADEISDEAKAAAKDAALANATAEQAQAQADAAQAKADEAKEQADAAATSAGEATVAAENAQNAANEAAQAAADADAKALAAQAAVDKVETTVETMQTDVSNAQSAAEAAQQEAAQAVSKATEAEEAAKSAADKANAAQAAADAAQTAAGSATDKAEAAQTAAGEAKTQAADASTTAAAAKLDAEQANKDIAALGEELETVSNTMTADYARKTDLTEATASLQSQITQNAGQISSTVTKLAEVDETANDAAEQAAAAQTAASAAQGKADAATADAAAAQSAADEAAAAAATAQSNADTANAAAEAAQSKADQAAADLATAEANLASMTSRVDATEEDIAEAQQAVTDAQAAADAAQADATEAATKAANAQTTANNAVTAASNAQTAADEAAEAAATAQETADKAKGDAAAAQTKANEAATAAANAQSTADTAKTNAATAQSKANEAAAAAATAQKAADDADAKAAQAAADLATAEQNLADVTSRVGATEEEIEAAQAAVETAQAAADKAKSDAATAQSTADTAKANAATAQTAANNAKAAADAAQADADAAKDAADKAQADVDALAVRVTTAETKITQNTEAIELRATKTEVTQTLGGYYTKAETEAKITETAESITSTVSSTYATKETVDSIEIGGRNLAIGTHSEWVDVTVNEWSAQLWHRVGGVYNYIHALSDYGISAGDWITLSVDLNAINKRLAIRVDCYNTDSTRHSTNFGNYVEIGNAGRSSITLQATDDFPIFYVYIGSDGAVDGNTTEQYKCFKVEKGNKATDWTPAPEEVDANIKGVADSTSESIGAVNERVTAAFSEINQLATSIQSLVVDGDGASLMTQTDSGWKFSVGSIQDSLDTTAGALASLQEAVGEWDTAGTMASNIAALISIVNSHGTTLDWVNIGTFTDDDGEELPCIELGESDSDYKLLITNKAIFFKEGSTAPTKIQDNTLVTNNVEVKHELKQGNWVWSVRSNGNFGLSWKEV